MHSEHEDRFVYFHEGEINLLCSHTEAVTPAEWDSWIAALPFSFQLERAELGDEAIKPYEIKPQSILTIPVSGDRTQTFLHTRYMGLPDDRTTEHDLVVIKAINEINSMVMENRFRESPIELMAAAPNWVFSGTTHAFTHVGPGGYPVPALNGSPTNDKLGKYKTKVNGIIRAKATTSVGKGVVDARQFQQVEQVDQEPDTTDPVNVVIFDTVPPRGQINTAYANWNGINPRLQALKTCEDSGQLVIKYATDLGIALPDNVPPDESKGYTNEAYYNMSDHGFFIAGVIHEMAQNSKIYLLQVLNDFGVCTTTSLAQAISALINRVVALNDAQLIVNCSLCVDFSSVAGSGDEIVLTFAGFPPQRLQHGELCKRHMRMWFEALQANFAQTGIRIVAAAGNDGQQSDTTLRAAHYPAAYDFVLGVGALDDAGNRAWYSNKADVPPPDDGVLVFGGSSDVATDKTDPQGGMLGVYTSKTYPEDANPNENGLARWSGTSFATAVMSGILARGAGAGRKISRDANDNFYKDIATASTPSANGEARFHS